MRILGRLAVLLIMLAVVLVWTVRQRYGGGDPFPNRSTTPLLSPDRAEIIATLQEAPGNIAVSQSGRIFITIHPESKPEKLRVAELVNGSLKPFPDAESQRTLFNSPQGIRIDRQNRLWTIDHGDNARQTPRLLGFDLDTGKEIHRFDFPSDLAPVLSYLQDLVIAPDGKTIYIADLSFFRKNPAILVYDIDTKTGRRVLESEESTSAQNYLINTYNGPITRLGGLISLKAGVDSISIDDTGSWLYYGALNHTDLFRVETRHLLDASVGQVASLTEKYAPKVQSDGISLDKSGSVYLTDVEHSSIAVIGKDRKLKTLVKHPKMRWPDGLSFGPGGYLYVADSALPDLVMRSPEQIRAAAPFFVFRVKLEADAVPGQ